MARGIFFDDFFYEVDEILANGERIVNALMYIRMDKWNIGNTDKKIKESTNTGAARIKAHVSNYLNEKEWGVHPRYLVGELVLTAIDSKCYGIQPKRRIAIPVLTLEQFDEFKVFDKKKSSDIAQPDTVITINHSRDGSVAVDYKIIDKVAQVLI